MKITLVEERDGRQPVERSFEGPVIKVGRDSSECDGVFEIDPQYRGEFSLDNIGGSSIRLAFRDIH